MYENYIKRALDVVVSVPAVIVLLVPSLLLAIIIKLDSRGPVIFQQLRYGKNKRPFMAYKFRTMADDTPELPTNSFTEAHLHITSPGKIMRKLSIDELPQLYNVIRGDMSIVGPRPVILSEISLIEERDKYNANSVKPGITGWAQANGRDELDDIIKAQMDGYYVANLSFLTDVKCVLLTIKAVLFMHGHSEGHEQTDSRRVEVDATNNGA